MAGKLLLPALYEPIAGPLVFLAGPIHGAPDWQSQAIAVLQGIAPALHIACPRRIRPTGPFNFNAQVDWETHHLRRAAEHGAILFWLASEVEHDCGRAYAQTTRFELGEWKMRHE